MTAERARLSSRKTSPRQASRILAAPPAPYAHPANRALHAWLATEKKSLVRLSSDDVRRFLGTLADRLRPQTMQSYRSQVLAYLWWLKKEGHISFDRRCLMLRAPSFESRVPLPLSAAEFVASLTPTLKPSTCRGYESSLTNFCGWLHENRLSLRLLQRPHTLRWLRHLHDRGLHPSTRLQMLQRARTYLWWLAERGKIAAHPADLIRPSDCPKLPSYLPRPLPPEVDRELRRRLALSSDLFEQGLLLMRNTGIRVGELRALDFDCLRTDPAGHSFLKVNLGKTNSERLVPLDQETVALIHRLRCHDPSPRRRLLQRYSDVEIPSAVFNAALKNLTRDLPDVAPITSHRLRHTYATSLLSAGMSLPSIMKLLGHRDYRMTLRYTAITQEVVRDEYLRALRSIANKYGTPSDAPSPPSEAHPSELVANVARWLRSRHPPTDPAIRALLKRVNRLASDLRAFAATSSKAGELAG